MQLGPGRKRAGADKSEEGLYTQSRVNDGKGYPCRWVSLVLIHKSTGFEDVERP